MIAVTKIFRFEMAHALCKYEGACKNIHGHSYVLHVTVASTLTNEKDFLPGPGFILDFKVLKKWVNTCVIEKLDHQLVLSEEYLYSHPHIKDLPNLVIWEREPSAENILLFIQHTLAEALPDNIQILKLLLFETADSYAEWNLSSQ